MKNYRRIMQSLTTEQLMEYAQQLLEIPEADLAKLGRDKLIGGMMEDDGENFSEAWEMENEDYGDTMHPDETDEEFDSHEDPDKD